MSRAWTTARSTPAIAAALLLAAPALAHEVGLSRGEYTLEGGVLTAQITFARREVIGLVAGLDENGDGALTAAEVERSREAFAGAIAGRIKVDAAGAACAPELISAALADEDGLTVRARYRCPGAAPQVKVDLTLLDDLPFGHRHLARLTGNDGPSDALLSRRDRRFSLSASLPRPGAPTSPSGAAPSPASPSGAPLSTPSPFLLGVARIVTRPDPLLLLLALSLGRAGRRPLALAALAFSAASLLGLVLAARGLFVPSPAVLGPCLALALVYLGLDTLRREPGARPWLHALPFGLAQGFALALLPAPAMALAAPASLAPFAVGALLTSLAAAALLVAAVSFARERKAWRDERPGALLAALGLAWLLLLFFAR
jgi:hypothetical protein